MARLALTLRSVRTQYKIALYLDAVYLVCVLCRGVWYGLAGVELFEGAAAATACLTVVMLWRMLPHTVESIPSSSLSRVGVQFSLAGMLTGFWLFPAFKTVLLVLSESEPDSAVPSCIAHPLDILVCTPWAVYRFLPLPILFCVAFSSYLTYHHAIAIYGIDDLMLLPDGPVQAPLLKNRPGTMIASWTMAQIADTEGRFEGGSGGDAAVV
ncbi:unnamed protein product [Mycena citricolor]|uniref:Uncharacterized protein n=1 Tax=Mycena citricolor TaxID=2018698 RepID=A0AAD2HGS8_9AGAR|nr:unnamed protein product [Mycena citricolor]